MVAYAALIAAASLPSKWLDRLTNWTRSFLALTRNDVTGVYVSGPTGGVEMLGRDAAAAVIQAFQSAKIVQRVSDAHPLPLPMIQIRVKDGRQIHLYTVEGELRARIEKQNGRVKSFWLISRAILDILQAAW